MRAISLLMAAAAVCAISVPCDSQAASRVVPGLSGTYVFTNFENCGSGLIAQGTGTVTFNESAKTWSQAGYKIVGTPLSLQTVSASGTYSNTATTITFSAPGSASSTYNVFYGASSKGITNYFSAILLASGPCGLLLTMTRQ